MTMIGQRVMAIAWVSAFAAIVVVPGLPGMAQESSGGNRGRGDAERGRQIYYDQTCYGCHGFNGETGARDLVGTDSPVLANAEAFTRFLRLRADQAPLFPSTRMPNYPEETVSDDDARDLFAYIQTFELHSPEIEDVPVLRQILESADRPYSP